MNKRASAYKLRDRFLVQTDQITTAGVWLAAPEYVCLGLDSPAEEIGKAFLSALEDSGQIVPHPTKWAGLAKPRLDAAGVKSEAAFQKGTQLVTVLRSQMETEIQPTRNGGASGDNRGFHDLPNKTIRLSNQASALEVGQAIIAAFASCFYDT
jgi:hypothetical protein